MLNPIAIFHIRDGHSVEVPSDRQVTHHPDRVAAKEYQRLEGDAVPEWSNADALYEVNIGDAMAYIPVDAIRERTSFETPTNGSDDSVAAANTK